MDIGYSRFNHCIRHIRKNHNTFNVAKLSDSNRIIVTRMIIRREHIRLFNIAAKEPNQISRMFTFIACFFDKVCKVAQRIRVFYINRVIAYYRISNQAAHMEQFIFQSTSRRFSRTRFFRYIAHNRNSVQVSHRCTLTANTANISIRFFTRIAFAAIRYQRISTRHADVLERNSRLFGRRNIREFAYNAAHVRFNSIVVNSDRPIYCNLGQIQHVIGRINNIRFSQDTANRNGIGLALGLRRRCRSRRLRRTFCIKRNIDKRSIFCDRIGGSN